MLTLFIDISDIRRLFLITPEENTGEINVLTENDFKVWLFEAVNFLNLIYTDFAFTAEPPKHKLSKPAPVYEGITELYESLLESLDHPELKDKEILASYGYVHGDLLYFQLEVGDDN